jgi:hypothetical protein
MTTRKSQRGVAATVIEQKATKLTKKSILRRPFVAYVSFCSNCL